MILQNAQGDARIIAGGQSLMPMLNFRLATPTLLIDLNRIAALSGIGMTENGLRIGAMTRTRDIETSALIAQHQPLIAHAVPHIAHLPIRSRGTIGGSLSHADPAAEFPALMLALDAEMVLHGPHGSRAVPAAEYFQGLFETATKSAEILTHIDVPHWPDDRRFGFQEYSRRRGDFALAGIAFWADMDGDICRECRVVAFGVSDRPVRLRGVEQILQSRPLNDADAMLQARDAVHDLLEPDSDLQASAEYRRMLAAELLQRAVHAAGGMA